MRSSGNCEIDAVLSATACRVAEIVAPEFGVSVDSIYGGGRWEPAATARQVCMHTLRTIYGWGFSLTARAYGRGDHATAMHAVRTVRGKKADVITDERLERIKYALATDRVNARLKEIEDK